MSSKPRLSIIIPAFNEAQAIRSGNLKQIRQWMSEQAFETELIVVDDGSTDETKALAEKEADRVLSSQHSGKAGAILHGMQAYRGELWLWTDMDLATPISEASRLLATLDASTGMVIGSRGWHREGAPLRRKFLGLGHTVLRTLLGLGHFTDTQCGFKMGRRQAADQVMEKLRLFSPQRIKTAAGPSVNSGFDVEWLVVAESQNIEVKELPVVWHHHPSPRVRFFYEAFNGVATMLQILLNRWRGLYR